MPASEQHVNPVLSFHSLVRKATLRSDRPLRTVSNHQVFLDIFTQLSTYLSPKQNSFLPTNPQPWLNTNPLLKPIDMGGSVGLLWSFQTKCHPGEFYIVHFSNDKLLFSHTHTHRIPHTHTQDHTHTHTGSHTQLWFRAACSKRRGNMACILSCDSIKNRTLDHILCGTLTMGLYLGTLRNWRKG